MKLSDVKGERTLDVIADIIDPICNIAEDKKAVELFKTEKVPDGVEPRAFAAKRLKKGIPPLIKTHKDDIIAILSAIEGVSPKKYSGTLNLFKLIKDFTELITDEEFTNFFISVQSGDSSGDASENTADQKM